MIHLHVLKNGNENNLLPPANPGDFGYDIVAASDPKIVGTKVVEIEGDDVSSQNIYSSIDYIEYNTGLVISPDKQRREVIKARSDDVRVWEQNHDVLASLIYPRSSISKYNLLFCNSVPIVDVGYLGNVILRYRYIYQPIDLFLVSEYKDDNDDGVEVEEGHPFILMRVNMDKIYKKGDKCAQLVCVRRDELSINYVDSLEETARSTGAFGSTGV